MLNLTGGTTSKDSFSISGKTYWRRLANDYDAHVAQVGRHHPSAARLKVSKCLRCGLCCYQYPCIPRPEEIEPVAEYLNLTVVELINRYMVIDTTDCQAFFLRWAKHGEEDITGKRIPPARTFDRGYCIFYDEAKKSCLIHPVRPKEAQAIKCWESKSGYDKSLWGITGWAEKDIYRFLPDFSSRIGHGNNYLPPESAMVPKTY